MQIKFPTVEDVQEDQNFIDKLLQFKWYILAGVALFLSISLFIASGGSRRMTREKDFFTISKLLQELKDGDEEVNESKIASYLNSYPEIRCDFDCLLRDHAVLKGDDASKIEDRILSRLSYLHPFYRDHMKVVQLIEQESFEEAQTVCAALISNVEEKGVNQFPVLYSFSVARLGYIKEKLGNPDSNKEAWARIKELLTKEDSPLGKEGQSKLVRYMRKDDNFFSEFFEQS